MANRCSKCNAKLSPGAKFCTKCGAPVEIEEAHGTKQTKKSSADSDRIQEVPMDQTTQNMFIARLERETRLWKRISFVLAGVLFVIVIIAMLLMALRPKGGDAMAASGYTPSVVAKSIQAEEFILKASNGKTVGYMGTDDEGTKLVLLDDKGNERAAMAVLSNGSAEVSVVDKNEAAGAAFGTDPDGLPYIGIADNNGSPRILFMTHEGSPVMVCLDEEGEPLWIAPQSLEDRLIDDLFEFGASLLEELF